MSRVFHVIAGLPRSGSTLLATMLDQNPRFKAGITSPVMALMQAVMPLMSGRKECAGQFSDEQRLRTLLGLLHSYHPPDVQVAFDTNRAWPGKLALLHALQPDAKVICCVRDVVSILNSLEAALIRHPLHDASIDQKDGQRFNSQYSRVSAYMNLNHGLVGLPWAALKEAWHGPFSSKLIILDYQRFTMAPLEVLDKLYTCLDQAPYPHDPERLSSRHQRYDDVLGMPDLHQVRPCVHHQPRASILAPDIAQKFAHHDFWKELPTRERGITVL